VLTGNTRLTQGKRGAMGQPECVVTVKELMAKLCRAKNVLVERLNAINAQIEEETDPVSKELLKGEWMAEKERSVEPLQKVAPFPPFCPPSSNHEQRDWQFIAKQPASAPHMLHIVPHTVPRVGRSTP